MSTKPGAGQSHSFSADKALSFIQQSISSSQIVVDKTQFRNDLTESTCMLVLDGLDYTFSHRSFQEYFAAYFLARVKVDEIARIVPRLVEINGAFDNVLKMLSEMNSEKFEEAWALPTLERMCGDITGIDATKNPIKFCRAIMGEPVLHFDGGAMLRFTIAPSTHRQYERYAVYMIYDLYNQIQGKLKTERNANDKILKRFKTGELLGLDNRFDELRKVLTTEKPNHATIEIKLVESDDAWLSETYFGKFLVIESKVLPQLRVDIAARVAARQKGLAAIFD